jgi:hypothetical protein
MTCGYAVHSCFVGIFDAGAAVPYPLQVQHTGVILTFFRASAAFEIPSEAFFTVVLEELLSVD